MSKVIEDIIKKARKTYKKIVLAEGEEPRTVEAARVIAAEKIAAVTLLGDIDKIGKMPEGVRVIDPKRFTDKKYARLLYELRKSKGMTPEEAEKLSADPLYFGTLMVKAGDADGMVAGAVHSTGDTLRPALQIIKAAEGVKTVSSFFIVTVPDRKYGDGGTFIFSDAGLVPDPTSEQLFDIASASADTAKNLCGMTPAVALLSFSTHGSASHPLVDKVAEAARVLKERRPDILSDGELQADAALVPAVAALKAPKSAAAGRANVLIFPDLNSGNIGYKLVQRLAGAEAVGPICQGLAKPVNDLSRGCDASDIVKAVAVTALQSLKSNR